MDYILSSRQYPGTFFSFAYILLMISPPYGRDTPTILTTLISGVTIFYRPIMMPDFATPTFFNAVNLLTSLDNRGIHFIFGLPTRLNHAHIRHLTNNPPGTGHGCYVLAYQGGTGARAVLSLWRCEFTWITPGGVVAMLVLTLSVDGDMTVLRFRSKFSKSNGPKYFAMKTWNIIYV